MKENTKNRQMQRNQNGRKSDRLGQMETERTGNEKEMRW